MHGDCDPAFAPVRDAFARNFTAHGEVGAACTVYVDGRRVVDVWGGHRDAACSQPWSADTIANFYSVGKPLAALCLLQLVAAGVVDLDAPVARYWPEFAAAGKEGVTVRQVMCHQAGLPAVRRRLPAGAMLDWSTMTEALAAEAPWWEPGTRHVYHTNTYGFLTGEIVRRVTAQSIGARFASAVAGPLDVDVWFGLPDAEHARCAEIIWPDGYMPPPVGSDDVENLPDEQRMVMYSYANPSGLSGVGVMNTPEWRRAEIPSTNGHGTARGVARIYAALAAGGTLRADAAGIAIVSSDVLGEATRSQSDGWCPVLERDVNFGLGFQLTRPDRPLGPNPRAFGHFGTGGSLGFADPDAGVGFGYILNDVVPRWQSPRNRALIDALYDCL